jgi:predicted dehydrogenase
MARTQNKSIFKTDKRIRLGIWGLGRGLSFYNSCRALNFDVVAGCDYNAHMRENFLQHNPAAFVTDNAEEFLAADFDAVLLATFCPAHADDAIACLRAGKHVLSEVTSFHTMAEGVRLVEAVEKSGLIYNLAENYPWSEANMWLARKWREGLFGELMYGEYEYVHEVLTLSYTYIDGKPIVPGDQVHSWRSWLNYHYYNTHSLGPMMEITGTRPTRVVALPGRHALPGYLTPRVGMGGVAPSLITMSNGGIVRNLMGATTNDTHQQRLWGTKGSAEIVDGHLRLRLGGGGGSPKLEVVPQWDDLGELAAKTGHGGGDFWVLYFFARQVLEGTPAPFDIYAACDCTSPGILALRSAMDNGQPYDVPDFRDAKQRNAYRNDHWDQQRYDAKNGLFPRNADKSLTQQFSLTMRDLVNTTLVYRAFVDWSSVQADMKHPAVVLGLADDLIRVAPRLQEVQHTAREIISRYPKSDGARVLGEMLAQVDEDRISGPNFVKHIKQERTRLAREAGKIERERARSSGSVQLDKWSSPFVTDWKVSKPVKKQGDVAAAKAVALDSRLSWQPVHADGDNMINVHRLYPEVDAIVYLGNRFKVAKSGTWTLLVGHDGGCQVFIDGKSVLCEPRRVNPASPDRSQATVRLSRGTHEIVCALDTDNGKGWGLFFRFEVPKSARQSGVTPQFPVVEGS